MDATDVTKVRIHAIGEFRYSVFANRWASEPRVLQTNRAGGRERERGREGEHLLTRTIGFGRAFQSSFKCLSKVLSDRPQNMRIWLHTFFGVFAVLLEHSF